MRNILLPACLALASSASLHAQGRPLDWSFFGGDAQRTGWEKTDLRITPENVKDFRLVLKRRLENGPGGPHSLTPPVIIGNLISYRGFKELGFVAGSSGHLWSIDVDMDRVFWDKQLAPASKVCPDLVAATPALTPPLNFAARPRPAGPARSPGIPPTPAGAPAATPAPPRSGVLGSTAFGAPRPAFVLANDGRLHFLNTSNGDDVVPPIPFVPSGAKASSLTISEGVMYTTTTSGCGDVPPGVWALDLGSVDPKDPAHAAPVASFLTKGEPISTLGGAAFGANGAVYIQTSRTFFALQPKTLALKQQFAFPGDSSSRSPATPVVFPYKGRDFIATAGPDGTLDLFDSQSLESPVSHTVIAGVSAGLSTFLDPAGTRWVFAPVWGPQHGSVVALKLEDRDGKPALIQAWTSPEMMSPAPVAITSGIVFALSTGGHATLYALDALTGKQLYSTGGQVTAPGSQTGLTVANGRVYFTTTDNTLWAFGIFLER